MRSITGFLIILSTVVALSIAKPSSSAVIECDFKNNYRDFEEIYECEVRNKDDFKSVDGVAPVIERIVGDHKSGMSDEDVHTLSMRDGTMDLFFKGVGTLFPNITAIHIENMQLEAIDKGDLDQFPHLKNLILIHNKIENITNGWLAQNTKIEVILLQKNSIAEIHPNAFSNLNYLKIIDLTGHQCPNVTVTKANNPNKLSKLKKEIGSGGCSNEHINITQIYSKMGDNFEYMVKIITDSLEYSKCQHTLAVQKAKQRDAIIKEQEDEINGLKRDLKAAQAAITQKDRTITTKDNEIKRLNRDLEAAKDDLIDQKKIYAEFNASFETLRRDIENRTRIPDRQQMTNLAALNDILTWQITLQEVLIKGCEKVPAYCDPEPCPSRKCPDCAKCGEVVEKCNQNNNVLTEKNDALLRNIKDAHQEINKKKMEMIKYQVQIAQLTAALEGRLPPPSINVPPPSPVVCPKCSTDSNEVKKLKEEYKLCQQQIVIISNVCTEMNEITANCTFEKTSLNVCKQEKQRLNEDLKECNTGIPPQESPKPKLCNVELNICKINLKGKEAEFSQCRTDLEELNKQCKPSDPEDKNYPNKFDCMKFTNPLNDKINKLNREMNSDKQYYEDSLSTCKEFENDFNKLKDQIVISINKQGKTCSADMDRLISLLKLEIVHKEILVKKCESRTKECLAGKCEPCPWKPCPDCSNCDGIMEVLSEEYEEQKNKTDECNRKVDDANQQIYVYEKEIDGYKNQIQICLSKPGSTCNEPECVKYTEPLQSSIAQWESTFQTWNIARVKLETEKSECLNNIINYNVSLANCVDSRTKECPTKLCLEPPTPSECDKTLGRVNQQLKSTDLLERDLKQYKVWYHEQKHQLEVLQGDLYYRQQNLNTLWKKLIDCEWKYDSLWKDCTSASPTKCPSGNTDKPGSEFYVSTYLGKLESCNHENSNLNTKIKECEENSKMANQFVSNMGDWINRFEEAKKINTKVPTIEPCPEKNEFRGISAVN